MATFKVHKAENYTVMSNTHLRDMNMSLKAKGMLSMMLSLPPTWDYSINGLVAICKEEATAIRSALTELERLGYLIRVRKHDENGHFDYEYNIYEEPQTDSPYTENPHTVEPNTDNSRQLSTDKSSTDEFNTDEFNTDELNIDKNTTTTAEDGEAEEENENELKLIGGKLGKGVVMMTEAQDEKLLEQLSLDEYNFYVSKLADFIISCTEKNGTPPTIKSHYRKILEWVEEDRKL